jgi:uncharacterized protein
MLSQDEQLQVSNAVSAIARRTAERLCQATDAWVAAGLVESMQSNIDRVVADWTPGDAAHQCSAGCAYCCEALVEVSDPEALRIARHIRTLPADRQQSLSDALTRQSARRAGAPLGDRVRCALLDGDLCTVYAHRPASCRKAHSLSVQACANREATIPQNFVVAVRCDVIVAGTQQGYKLAGLPALRNELSAAVLAALRDANAATDWFSGQALLPTPPAPGREAPASSPDA